MVSSNETWERAWFCMKQSRKNKTHTSLFRLQDISVPLRRSLVLLTYKLNRCRDRYHHSPIEIHALCIYLPIDLQSINVHIVTRSNERETRGMKWDNIEKEEEKQQQQHEINSETTALTIINKSDWLYSSTASSPTVEVTRISSRSSSIYEGTEKTNIEHSYKSTTLIIINDIYNNRNNTFRSG